MRGGPGKTHPPTPTKLSSSIFQWNFLGWSRKNFSAGSQKFRSVIILTSKCYILKTNWFRNGRIAVIFKKFSPVPYPDFRVWCPDFWVWYPEIRVLYGSYVTHSLRWKGGQYMMISPFLYPSKWLMGNGQIVDKGFAKFFFYTVVTHRQKIFFLWKRIVPIKIAFTVHCQRRENYLMAQITIKYNFASKFLYMLAWCLDQENGLKLKIVCIGNVLLTCNG